MTLEMLGTPPGSAASENTSTQSRADILARGSSDDSKPVEDNSESESEPIGDIEPVAKSTSDQEESVEEPEQKKAAPVSKEDDNEEETEATEEKPVIGKRGEAFNKFKKDNPAILKANPWIRDLVYREEQLTAIFPTVDDARQAASRLQIMDHFENAVMSGNPGVLLEAMSNNSKPALKKFTANFLESVTKIDQSVAAEYLISPILNRVLRAAKQVGQSSNNKNLALAVDHIANWLHGSPAIPADAKLDDKDPDIAADHKEKEFYENVKKSWVDNVISETENKVVEMISRNLDGIKLSKLMRKAVVTEIYEEINDSFKGDKNHISLMNSLWSKAFSDIPAGQHERHKSSLQSAILDRVKQMLPALKRKHLADVMPNTEHETKKVQLPNTSAVGGGENKAKNNGNKLTPEKLASMSRADILAIGAED